MREKQRRLSRVCQRIGNGVFGVLACSDRISYHEDSNDSFFHKPGVRGFLCSAGGLVEVKGSRKKEIEEIVNRETVAWDTKDVELLLSLFHPDMV